MSRGRPEARLFQNGRRTARQQRCVRSISNEAVENGKAKVPVQGAGTRSLIPWDGTMASMAWPDSLWSCPTGQSSLDPFWDGEPPLLALSRRKQQYDCRFW